MLEATSLGPENYRFVALVYALRAAFVGIVYEIHRERIGMPSHLEERPVRTPTTLSLHERQGHRKTRASTDRSDFGKLGVEPSGSAIEVT
jgi:hypothetical protein